MPPAKTLDVITIGRASVDLYGQQIGSRLEDIASFAKSVGGCPAFIASARAIVVTGTHFSRPNTEAAQLKAIHAAKANGGKVAFDIDYRPNLWGLAGHAEGFERYVKSDAVSAKLRAVLPDCDLVVGTEEEIMIASGADDVLGALKAIRALSAATIVLKRGAMGCIVY